MSFDLHKNFSYSTISTAPTPASSGTTIIVTDGTVFPAVPFNVTIWPVGVQPTSSNAEIARVTNISSNTLTITRAQESSSARSILIGDQIANTITAKILTDVETFSLKVSALADGATPALDASLGNVFTLSAAGDRTIAIPTNPTSGQKIIIAHTASGGARTLALNTGAGGFRFGVDIPALTQTSSGKTDYIGCVYNASAGFFDVIAVTRGF